MKNITEELQEFKTFEKRIFEELCRVGCELIGEYLRVCDLRLLALRDTQEYRAVNSGTTTIKTLMGEVPYTRRCYKKKTGGHVFLLDEILGIGGGCGLASENLAEQIVIACSEKSFRKAAGSISSLTGQGISAMGAWNVFQRFGERLDGQEKRLRELDQADAAGQLGNVACPVLFEEMDDVWLPMQREKRRKSGMPAEAGRKKTGKKPMHVGTAYTGWRQAKDGRFNTVDKLAYASFGDVPGFMSAFESLKRHRFDMDGVQHRITNGDGAAWIKTAAAENDTILQLDPFHRSRAVIRAISKKEDRKAVFDAIREKDVEKVLRVTYDMVAKADDDAAREKLGKLYGYFHENKDSLLTWQERGIELPEAPEGVVYRSLGIQESSNCDLITQRMKRRKGSWTIAGANHMAKTLCFRHTIGLDAILGLLPEPQEAALTGEPLSVAKTPLHDGKGVGNEWLRAGMPFEQAFRTHGREAIRGLLKQKPL